MWIMQSSIHPTTSTSTKSTTELLEQDFTHFGYPHTIVLDSATSFSSEEVPLERHYPPHRCTTPSHCQWCCQTLSGSDIQAALSKSSLPTRAAPRNSDTVLPTPRSKGYSPSELLNGRQNRTKIAVLLPSPAHAAQVKQAREATVSSSRDMPQNHHKCTTSWSSASKNPCTL